MKNWTWTALDQQAASTVQMDLPAEVFDAHAHLYRSADLGQPLPNLVAEGKSEVGQACWREHVGRQVGKQRLAGGLLFPFPSTAGDLARGNQYLFEQIAGEADLKGLALVAPGAMPEQFQTLLDNSQFAGFKPYHLFSSCTPTFKAPISSFLPDWASAIAHDRGLVIMLHLVRDSALADPENQRELRHFCAEYPNARLVLAHAARGFHALNTVKGLGSLRGFDNVWFDTSGICEPTAIKAIIDAFGPRRLIWGSDFPVSEIRGRCVTVGDGFAWLQPGSAFWEKAGPQANPTLVGLESLRALLTACAECGLNAADRQDIFANNARRLLGLLNLSGTQQTQDLYHRAKARIPGGTQLLSKRPEMMAPNQWPAYFREARGFETWDLDGRRYYDFSTNGIGSCLLGFRDPDVTRAVQRRINLGSMCTLNPPEEVELADLLCEIHPWAEQARFARCGGEACAIAVRIARAATDRSLVAICGYHGWQDWYLAANLGESDSLRGHLLPGLSPLGVPAELRGTAATFTFNDTEAFQNLLDKYGDRLAAVIMEPCRTQDPAPGFLQLVRDGAHRVGALLIFDEITIGWRLHFGGAHLKFGVKPDLAVFAKAIGNGHPMAAVIGTSKAMNGAHESFISSTYWTESVGPVAALATLRKMKEVDVPTHVAHIGARVQALWSEHGQRHGLPVQVGGYPCLAHLYFEHPQAEVLRTLYVQKMLTRDFLASTGLYPTLAHTDEIVDTYGKAIDEVFGELADLLATGDDLLKHLGGPVAHKGFRRLS